jgi:hypothetical protein
VASAAKPDTVLAWLGKFVEQKFDGTSIRVVRPSDPISPISSSAWHVRIAAGDTIASPAHSPISVTTSPIKPWVTSYVALVLLRLPSVATG